MPKSGITKVEVTPGSQRHDILVEENVQENDDTTEPQSERRKSGNPVNVQVGPSSGGLIGWPATLANMSAVGFVLVLLTIMYMDFRSSVKDERALMREDNRLTREAQAKTDAAMVAAIEKQTTAMTVQSASNTAALMAVQTKMETLAVSNQSLINEFKADRAVHTTKLDEVIRELKAANNKKP